MIAVNIGDQDEIGRWYAVPATLRRIDDHHLAARLDDESGMHNRRDLQWPGAGFELFYGSRGEAALPMTHTRAMMEVFISVLSRATGHHLPKRTVQMISCRELTRRFGDLTAVDHLTLEVAKGSICAFLGPNGAGKSTTVKMLCGLLSPSSGEATICGLKAGAHSLELKRKMGVLPENLGLFDDLTVDEHLLLTGQVYGLPAEATMARMEQLLNVLDLRNGRKTFASQCSHGMRKKTALAMALLPNPEVLFLDEPFEAIDPVTSKIMRDLLVNASRRGVTVFLTSHISFNGRAHRKPEL